MTARQQENGAMYCYDLSKVVAIIREIKARQISGFGEAYGSGRFDAGAIES
ncbi:MAG: hypothetical protein KatS3mg082_0840 [Nitrospiraceae bacterium]|jgi:hypothetical protein|nr:MAG: hypothetical protein KatS3mg082_0840 [Nitrospiraceae bacterium]